VGGEQTAGGERSGGPKAGGTIGRAEGPVRLALGGYGWNEVWDEHRGGR
jgi:hypothetical protein